MSFFDKKYLPALALFVLALALYANTLGHGFVLDDQIVITQNDYVKQGWSGIYDIFSHDTFAGYSRLAGQENSLPGGRYRPLSLAVFAVFYSIFGENTLPYHVLAVLLYALTGVLLFVLLRNLFTALPQGTLLAGLTTGLFIVHPVHTEVVANIKSCDEQLALLFGLGAWLATLRAYDTGKKWSWPLTGLLFFLACLSKENAVLLAILVPFSLVVFRKASIMGALRQGIPIYLALTAFLIIRAAVTSSEAGGPTMSADPLNNPFLVWNGSAWLPCSAMERAATVLYTLGYQLRLLALPHPLTSDYYHLQLQSCASPAVWFGLLALAVTAFIGIFSLRKQADNPLHSAVGFGIVFLLLTIGLTANILFPIGAFMAERFLYLPSVGFCIAAVAGGKLLFDKYATKRLVPFFVVAKVVFILLTLLRNPAWKDNATLLGTDIHTSTGSPKLNSDYGTQLLEKGLQDKDPTKRQELLAKAQQHLRTALDHHPTYYDAYLAHGACSYYLGEFDAAVASYRAAFKLSPQDPKSKLGLQYALQAQADAQHQKGQTDAAITAMTEAWQLQPDTLSATHLAIYYRAKNEPAKAVEWMEKAVELVPRDERLAKKIIDVTSGH
ncbi:MAG: glycosyltransferase family 39 protein [Saprospiraceae bacterium]|nr:glycosyltransferase family 39 protein [Saprospiraceae bacterium]